MAMIMLTRSSVLLSFLLCLPTISISLVKQDIATDRSALLAMKSIVVDPSDELKSWSNQTIVPVCNWTRVICSSRHQRVVFLNLSYVGLQGRIAPQIGNLSFLTYIDFRRNSFQGELPQEMMHLQRLRYIDLNYNLFSGDIPSWLGFLPNLLVLHISNNSFTGTIPISLFNASKLVHLNIEYNSLQGSIPQEISKKLRIIDMEGNQLTGSIPQSIFNLTSLEFFNFQYNSLSGDLPLHICSKLSKLLGIYLSENQLSGKIQSRFDNCSQLQFVSIGYNNLSGLIPRGIGNLTTLSVISLWRNKFTGEIPPQIGNLLNLKKLAITENFLTGQLPQEIGNLQMMEILLVSSNSLSGPIPSSMFNMSSITYIDLNQNNISGSIPPCKDQQLQNLKGLYLGINALSGVIPDSFSNLTQLTYLELAGNGFTGSIPASLGSLTNLDTLGLSDNLLDAGSSPELSFLTSFTNCRNLRSLKMARNPLKGTLPRTIGNFSSSLTLFDASGCEIEGSIPHDIGNLSGLSHLSLGQNLYLSGPLPLEIQWLLNLQRLDLGGNNISGSIPNFFCDFKKLYFLSLAENQFTGQVSECFGNITSLRSLFLYSNKLNSTMPASLGRLGDLMYLDVHSNSLSGDIPPEIGNMNTAILLDLSHNKFSGQIPSSIGDLEVLINLSLAHNQLQGPIPEKLSNMLSLELLDLSQNNLSGEIPLSMTSLPQLKYFNVSFNELRGEIPINGSFKNFTYESFMSNKALCGGHPYLQFPPCPRNSTQKSGMTRSRILAYIFIPMSLTIFVMISSFMVFLKNQRRNSHSPRLIVERISFYEVQHATNGFCESNLLASGSYGSVYKGVLKNGTIVAIKVFNLEPEGSCKSFDRECEALRNIRHRNLVKVISSCSNLDFKALILEYMPNGSLEKWLYSHNYFLDFSKRLGIMIDVASALHYLHHGYTSTIVHCDLKPSNVLLDEDMTGRVCDFGIAKLFAGDEDMTQTKTLATIGYIAPEYGSEGKVSTSCDVYSFGILLMETFSRKKPTDEMFTEDWGLKEWIASLLRNSSTDFIDQNLITSTPEASSSTALVQSVTDIMELALTCTVVSMNDRIDIESALAKLEKIKLLFTQGQQVQRTL